jgi:CHRD domain
MKRYGHLVGAAVLLATLGGCDDDSPTAPTNNNTIVFTAQMTAANEVPPITGTEANARGDVRITLDVVRDGNGVITSGTASFVINLSGFPAATNAVAAHIHEGAPGVAGGVRIGVTPITASTPISMPNGTATNATYNGITLDAVGLVHANAMLTNPNGYYFNVHTTTNPGGAVRGPLVIQ